MNAHKKNAIVSGIRTYTPPLNAILLTVLISMIGYWGNQITLFMNNTNHHFDVIDTKQATDEEISSGNRINIVNLMIDNQNTKTDIATIKAVTPYFKNH